MELYILDAGNTNKLIAKARCGDDLVIEPLQTEALRELEAFKERLKIAAEAKAQRPSPSDLRNFAEKLFAFAMPNRLRDVYSRPTEALSLQILSNHPVVQDLPWEYMIVPGAPLIPDRRRRVVRLAESSGSRALPPKKLGSKIRVLYAFADPNDLPFISWEEIHQKIMRQFTTRMEPGTFEIKVVPGVSYEELHKELSKGKYDVFHFNGHGDVLKDKTGTMVGKLMLRKRDGTTEPVSAEQLTGLFSGLHLRLAVFSACKTSGGSFAKAHAVIAKALVNGAGVSAVVANQFSVTTELASTFASTLYSVLLNTGNIDEAFTEGRITLNGTPQPGSNSANIEWGIPTLYRHINSAQIFEQ